jgi:hypothetical protein
VFALGFMRKSEPFGALPLSTCMKTIKSLTLSLMALIGAEGAVSAQPFPTNINPALTYYQAFVVAPDLSPNDEGYLYTNERRGQKLPERFGELMATYDREFRLLRQATHSTAPCEWGIDWSAGPEAILPHLPRIKKAAVAARLRVMWDLQHDHQTDARDDLLAVLALGRNGASDGCLIGALVQIAVERIVCSAVAGNFSQFSPETLQQLSEGINGPPARGTIAACISMEKFAFSDWMVNRVERLRAENAGNDAKAMEAFHSVYDFETASVDGPKEKTDVWQQIVAASGGTSDGVLKLMRDMDPYYARLASIEALPFAEYEEQAKQFSADIKSSSNPFIHEFFPAVEKCRPKEFSALADLAMVQAAVQYKLHGEAGLQSVSNPLGQGPFGFRRFIFDGVDRGFELDAAYSGLGYPEVLIFVETDGAPFLVWGKNAGKTSPSP